MSVEDIHDRNADQGAYWNGEAGRRWAQRQQDQDAQFTWLTEVLMDRSAARAGERAIDIGCGCGRITIELAQRVAPAGRVLGVDISEPMLDMAREVSPPQLPIDYVLADATVFPFEQGKSDLVCSRFGVMFFADPAVSFTNIRRALRAGGRLVFACWRDPKDNPFLTLPLHEAYKHVPRLPESGPDDPGPFAYASEDRVRGILEAAGFSGIAFERVDFSIDIALGGGLDAAVQKVISIGPTSRALQGQEPRLRDAAIGSVRAALAKLQKGETIPLAASVWIVTAKNP